jgi:hypothetical protein
MDFRWIGSVSLSLLDGLDDCPRIQSDPVAKKGRYNIALLYCFYGAYAHYSASFRVPRAFEH